MDALRAEWDKARAAFDKAVIPYEKLAKCDDRDCSCWWESRVAEVGRKLERKRVIAKLDTLLGNSGEPASIVADVQKLRAELAKLS